ncbi:MAG: YidC/Oxa1 family membrane protein insertase [Dehalococcoidia bacterium]|nr:YidC/Oxa1 family membrane protein insertase [Dehalococcoidia bacterium]
MPIGAIFNTLLVTPLVNLLIALSAVSFGSFGIAILLLTFIVRGVTFPLTLRSLHAMRAMQQLQPRLDEVKKKYSDPRRRSEETMKLYKEYGVNPLGCLGPQLLQMPIFFALYAVIRIALGNTPENVLELSSRLYPVGFIQHAVPVSATFLWMDLGETGNLFLVVVVFAAMWLQQRISSGRSQAAPGTQQAQMNQMMQWMMPAMFAWFVLAVPAGVGLYWAASTTIGIVLQWIFVGPGDFTWGSLIPERFRPQGRPRPALAVAGAGRTPTNRPGAQRATEAGEDDADRGSQREDGGGSGRPGTGAAGAPPRPGRRRRNQRR